MRSHTTYLAGALSVLLPSCEIAHKPQELFLYPKEAVNRNKDSFYTDRNKDYPLTILHFKNDDLPINSKTVLFTQNQKVVNTKHSLDVTIANLQGDGSNIKIKALGEYEQRYTQAGASLSLSQNSKNFGNFGLLFDYSYKEYNQSDDRLERTKIRLERILDNGFTLYVQADKSNNGHEDNFIYSGNIGYKGFF